MHRLMTLVVAVSLVACPFLFAGTTVHAAPAASVEDDVLYCNTRSECLEAFPLLMNWLSNNQKELFVPVSTDKIESTIDRYGSKKSRVNLKKGMANLPKALSDILDIFGKEKMAAYEFETYAAKADVDALEKIVVSSLNMSNRDKVRKTNATFVLEMGQAIDLADVPELRNLKVALYNWALLTIPMGDWPVTNDLSADSLLGKDACVLKDGKKICEKVKASDADSVTLENGEVFMYDSEDTLYFGDLPVAVTSNEGASIGLDVNPLAVFAPGADTAFVMKEGLHFDWTFSKPVSIGLGAGALSVLTGGNRDGDNMYASASDRTTGYVSARLAVAPSVSKNGRIRIVVRGEGSVFFNGGGSALLHVGPEFTFGKDERKVKGKCGFGVSGGVFDYGRTVSHRVDSTGVHDDSGDRNLTGPTVGGWASCGMAF